MVAQPTTAEKAAIVAQCATAIMCAPNSLQIYAETTTRRKLSGSGQFRKRCQWQRIYLAA